MEEKEFDYINMIPFIDVMLVLLTIVLTTSTFVMSGVIPVDLPKVANAYEKTMKASIIEIDNKAHLYYKGHPVDLGELKQQLTGVTRDTPFLIRADRSIPLQSFVDVIDIVKGMGFRKVSLHTEEVTR
jgi:biopolymer transport protein ExbD